MKIEIIESKQFELIASLVEEVQNLHANMLPNIYKPFEYGGIQKAIEPMLGNENCRVFIARSNNETMGYLMILIKEIPENAFHFSQRVVHIDQIAVSQTHQQSGVGSMLMHKVEEIAKDLSINRIELDHLHINRKASHFFANNGFESYREKRFKILD